MTTTHTKTAASHLQQAVQALRDALGTCSAVEGLALLEIISDAANLARRADALAQAMGQDGNK